MWNGHVDDEEDIFSKEDDYDGNGEEGGMAGEGGGQLLFESMPCPVAPGADGE